MHKTFCDVCKQTYLRLSNILFVPFLYFIEEAVLIYLEIEFQNEVSENINDMKFVYFYLNWIHALNVHKM